MLQAIEALSDEPRPPGVKKYRSEERDIYHIRVGNYRAVYVIEDDLLLVLVIRVGHRSDVYRRR
ncbi:MAG: type II toxin-antitoxin system RelE family toxin [Spirochaetota bacterium]